MVIGSVGWRGGSQEVTKPTATTRLKMENGCIFCNKIEIFWLKKKTETKRWKPFGLFKLQMALA
jgi:hypothetical protein